VSFEVHETASGLAAVTRATDARSVQAALRAHDPELRLVPQADPSGRFRWEVRRYMGENHPAVYVCAWMDEYGNPLELSHQLVDRVKQLDRNTVGAMPDPDELNARMLEDRRRDQERDWQAIVDDHKDRVDDRKRVPLFRGRSLYAARNRVRAAIKTREWKP